MGFVSFYLLPLSLAVVCQGYNVNFRLTAKFQDNTDIDRSLILDLTSSEIFVLRSTEFQDKYGRDNVFKPSASDTFENISQPFQVNYTGEYNGKDSTVLGFLGKDNVTIILHNEVARFGVAQKITAEEIVFGTDGYPNAGRIGFSRNIANGSLAENQFPRARKLSLEVGVSPNSSAVRTSIGLGDFNYDPKRLRTKVRSLPHPNGLWGLSVARITIGNVVNIRNYKAVITTTLDGITLPFAVFQQAIRTLGAKYSRENRHYTVDCNRNIPIILEINGVKITIRFDAIIAQLDKVCVLKLRSVASADKVVLGLPFFINNGIGLDYESGEIHLYDSTYDEDSVAINGVVQTANGARQFITTEFFE
ncbi:unnamed protein product [Bursaphelenchus xylophilus]|uniref:(pine wood nematode) hypothetical protein n=1 Tax=Bursaphelenchus xylophilus TaxID=6326 RepID=A0A1I7SRH9_BURXY|nr:unnamed protein product [Bursaphelenchus xylophilus]CAG9102359.1 unnamed protein product [Bursaphelenchus xylophilus]